MRDIILLYAVITIAYIQTRSLLVMDKMGKVHTISISWQFCLIAVVDSLSPWASNLYYNGHGYIYVVAHLISETLLLAAMLYTVLQKLRHLYRRYRGSSNT
jgi:hypothetical protein